MYDLVIFSFPFCDAKPHTIAQSPSPAPASRIPSPPLPSLFHRWIASDNGPATWLAPTLGTKGPLLCGKQTTMEGGMRVPSIVSWPGKIPPGRVTHGIGTVMDMFATIVEVTGVQPP